MAEQNRFQHIFWNRCTVDGNKRHL
jgi:hypothetical protein